MTRLNRKSWNQFVSLTIPYWVSDQKWTPIGLSSLLVVLLLAYTQFSVIFNQKLGEFTSALAAEDAERFWRNLRIFLLLLIVAVPVNAFYYFVRDKLSICWRRWLTTRLLGDYFSNRAYYHLTGHPTIDNPDQRIADDINTFTQKALSFLLIALNGLMQLVAFSAVLWSLSKILVAFLIGYALMGTIITIVVFGKGLTVLNYLQLKREADFRFSLIRVRENAESIAFYGGEDREKELVLKRFGRAFVNYNKLIGWQLFLSMFQYANSYASYLLPYFVLAPAILAGQLEVGSVVVAGGAFSACLVALNLVIDNFDSLSKFAAGIDRLDSFKKAVTAPIESNATDTIQYQVSKDVKLENVTLQIPHGHRVLIDDLSFNLTPGVNLIISGPSGCGKTSLLRAIIGLWNQGAGTIARPSLDELLFLPQRPYLIQGDLRSQLLYPRLDMAVTDDELRHALKLVQLPHLLESASSLSTEADWSKVLSIGEQQRLSFARLFLIRPKFAFLDEATSALDPKNEDHLYRELRKTDTTFISISHHEAVTAFHEVELELIGDGSWRWRTLSSTRGSGRPIPRNGAKSW